MQRLVVGALKETASGNNAESRVALSLFAA